MRNEQGHTAPPVLLYPCLLLIFVETWVLGFHVMGILVTFALVVLATWYFVDGTGARRFRQAGLAGSDFRVGVALVVAALVVFGATTVLAQTSGGGFLDGDSLGGQIVNTVQGFLGGSQSNGGGTNVGSGGGGGGGPAPDCVGYDPDNTAHTGPASYTAASEAISAEMDRRSAEGQTSMDIIGSGRPSADAQGTWFRKDCGGYPAGYVFVPQGQDPAAAAQPPAPPSPAEVRDRTPLPKPAFGVSPHVDGLTGLETWLWDANGGDGRTIFMTIRGYSVVSTASPTRWRWDMGGGGRNPDPVLYADRPGTEVDPAARYTYESPADYTLTLDTTWAGSFTFSGNGVAPQTVDLGTTTQSSSRGFHVAEVRPVLTGA